MVSSDPHPVPESPAMFLTRWLKSAPRTTRPRRPTNRFRPALEALDARDLPSGGVLDPTFDGDGVVTTQPGVAGKDAYAHDAAVYPAGAANAGKVVVVGGAYGGGRRLDFALVRYNADGSLDSGFGNGGMTTSGSPLTS